MLNALIIAALAATVIVLIAWRHRDVARRRIQS